MEQTLKPDIFFLFEPTPKSLQSKLIGPDETFKITLALAGVAQW